LSDAPFTNDAGPKQGTFIDSKGNKFEGQWEDDLQTGYGVKMFACGDMHEGGYLRGQRHGNGVYVWANGDRYNGQWKNGRMHGQGVFYWSVAACSNVNSGLRNEGV
jgi:hypothetical protein